MAASSRHKALLATLLAVSIGLKLSWPAPVSPQDRIAQALSSAADFLTKSGLTVDSTASSSGIMARLDTCRMQVMVVAPEGWQADTVQRLATADDDVFYLYKSIVYPQQPSWRTWVESILFRLTGYTGLTHRWQPVYAVIESRSCQVLQVEWSALLPPPT